MFGHLGPLRNDELFPHVLFQIQYRLLAGITVMADILDSILYTAGTNRIKGTTDVKERTSNDLQLSIWLARGAKERGGGLEIFDVTHNW